MSEKNKLVDVEIEEGKIISYNGSGLRIKLNKNVKMSEEKPFYVISEDKLKELIKPHHYTTFKWALRDIKASAVREVDPNMIINQLIDEKLRVFVEREVKLK